jgi:hypothetical protein
MNRVIRVACVPAAILVSLLISYAIGAPGKAPDVSGGNPQLAEAAYKVLEQH